MADLIPVPLGECLCPGAPHGDGDFAYLKPQADIKVGLAAHSAIFNAGANGAATQEEIQIALGIAYAWAGISKWDLLDQDGKPLPVSKANVEALNWTRIAPLADTASKLYSDEVLAPLVARASKSSPNGRTNGSTHRQTRSTSKRKKP